MVTLYQGGRTYAHHLQMKQHFNRASAEKKLQIIRAKVKTRGGWQVMRQVGPRGMTPFHDLVDWLGGLPYEVAYGPEIRQLYGTCGFKLLREDIRAEGMCSYWLFEQTKLPAHVHHRQMIERPRP